MKDFYIVREIYQLFGISKFELPQKLKQYDISLWYSEFNEQGLPKGAAKRLHYLLYHESRRTQQNRNRRSNA
ncbi:hypothetical protein D3Z48_19615 [Clostridiaceae bacterium]|nr:hypothetical protein [Clostridiaceae bacterium]